MGSTQSVLSTARFSQDDVQYITCSISSSGETDCESRDKNDNYVKAFINGEIVIKVA